MKVFEKVKITIELLEAELFRRIEETFSGVRIEGEEFYWIDDVLTKETKFRFIRSGEDAELVVSYDVKSECFLEAVLVYHSKVGLVYYYYDFDEESFVPEEEYEETG